MPGQTCLQPGERRVVPTSAVPQTLRECGVGNLQEFAFALRKGQRWNMIDQQLRVYHVGIRFVEFRVLKGTEQLVRPKLGRSSLEKIATVQAYLQRNQAVLGKE